MLQGMTAHYLPLHLRRCSPATRLVHAAAGGVGLLLTQMVKARAHGDRHHVHPREGRARPGGGRRRSDPVRGGGLGRARSVRSPAARRRGGLRRGGQSTFEPAWRACARAACWPCSASPGGRAAVDPQGLNGGGSLYLTRPTLHHYIATRAELQRQAGEVFAAVGDGSLRDPDRDVPAGRRRRRRTTELEGRRTTGKVLLVPS